MVLSEMLRTREGHSGLLFVNVCTAIQRRAFFTPLFVKPLSHTFGNAVLEARRFCAFLSAVLFTATL